MKSKVTLIIPFFVIIFMIKSGLFRDFLNFFAWLIMLNMTKSSVSVAGEIFVRVATWVISYSAVGLLFNALGSFNSNAMKTTYFVVSTLVSFALCYVVMLLETYLLYIIIALSILFIVIMTTYIIRYIKDKRKIKLVIKQYEREI